MIGGEMAFEKNKHNLWVHQKSQQDESKAVMEENVLFPTCVRRLRKGKKLVPSETWIWTHQTESVFGIKHTALKIDFNELNLLWKWIFVVFKIQLDCFDFQVFNSFPKFFFFVPYILILEKARVIKPRLIDLHFTSVELFCLKELSGCNPP